MAGEASCSGGISWLRLCSHPVDGLLQANHIFDTWSGLSSSRSSGMGCMRFALLTKVISTLRAWRTWSSARLRACNLDVFQARWRLCSHFAFRSLQLSMAHFIRLIYLNFTVLFSRYPTLSVTYTDTMSTPVLFAYSHGATVLCGVVACLGLK